MTKKAKCKHYFSYPHSIYAGRTANEVVVGRYCAACGLQQAARANEWGKMPRGYVDMKRELKS